MQILKVPKGKLVNPILVPPSKSYANRALILAALTGSGVEITNLPDASDVTNLIAGLSAVGLGPVRTRLGLRFLHSFPECEGEGELTVDVGEGGTTARFLAVLLLLGSRPYTLILGERLQQRPWDEFLRLAHDLGARAMLSGRMLRVQGPALVPKTVSVDCAKTTQFATALKLLGLRTGTEVVPKNLDASQSYWKMTEDLVSAFSRGVSSYAVPRDWSSASYPLAFAALNQSLELPGLRFDPLQADAKFLILLRSLGCVQETDDATSISRLEYQGSLQLDVSDCLDLVPALGFFLAHVEGEHTLSGVSNLIHKESDRLSEMISLLAKFGKSASTDGRTLSIRGSAGRLPGPVDLNFPDDHRMVMAGALFLRHHGGGTLTPASAVLKSYPDFFGIFAE